MGLGIRIVDVSSSRRVIDVTDKVRGKQTNFLYIYIGACLKTKVSQSVDQ